MLGVLALYGFEGLFVALAFVSVGASRLLPQPAPVSLGARILLLRPRRLGLLPCQRERPCPRRRLLRHRQRRG